VKALSLTQPWASLVALGEKRVETRSWNTNYRGLLAIHAAKTYPRWAKELAGQEPFYSSLRAPIGNYSYPELRCGQVLCIVSLTVIRFTQTVRDDLSEKELAFGDYSDGRFAWCLSLFEPVSPPIPAKGHLGLWEWER
jgi:hypothetical protein